MDIFNNKANKNNSKASEKIIYPQISYTNVKELNYLSDLSQKISSEQSNMSLSEIFNEKYDENQNYYDRLAINLQKKLIKNNGYIQKPQNKTKSKKKKKNQAQYDYQDQFIDDQGTYLQKKQIESNISNFKCQKLLNIDEFYESQIYKNSVEKVEDNNKKRDYKIDLSQQQLNTLKKKIKLELKMKRQQNKKDQELKEMQIEEEVQILNSNQIVQEKQKNKMRELEFNQTVWENQDNRQIIQKNNEKIGEDNDNGQNFNQKMEREMEGQSNPKLFSQNIKQPNLIISQRIIEQTQYLKSNQNIKQQK